MTQEEILEQWSIDANINPDKLHEEAINIPKLHSKYLGVLNTERSILLKLSRKKKKLELTLDDYFRGVIDGRDIGREPFNILVKTNSQIENRIQNDDEIVKINTAISLQEEKLLLLKEIMAQINQRNFQIKSAIDYAKFIGGM